MMEIASIGEPEDAYDDMYYYKEVDGIPVASIRAMITNDNAYDETLQFIKDTEKIKNEEVSILDRRMNGGGFQMINELWLYLLTDNVILPKWKKWNELIIYQRANSREMR